MECPRPQQSFVSDVLGFSVKSTKIGLAPKLCFINLKEGKSYTMPRIVCAACNRLFADTQYFSQHLSADSNIGCQNAFFRRKHSNNRGNNGPAIVTPLAKRQTTVADIGRVLEDNRQANMRRKAEQDVDYSVFDFHDSDSEAEMEAEPTNTRGSGSTEGSKSVKPAEPIKKGQGVTSGLSKFQAYVEFARGNYAALEPKYQAATELMDMMNRSGGSLLLYELVMDWHLKYLKTEEKVTATNLHATLMARYNMQDTLPYEITTELPCAKTKVSLACHDAVAQTVDLLTDPRISKEDYIFHEGHPSGKPPEDSSFVSDIHTSEAYKATFRDLIEPQPFTPCGRRRILCPYMIYLDGCVTGQFNNMEIEILKFTLGILNEETRNKDWAWRNLGFVHSVVKGHGEAETEIRESEHLDSQNYVRDKDHRRLLAPQLEDDNTPNFDTSVYQSNEGDSGAAKEAPKIPTVKAQDLHKMLQVLLSSYKTIEDADGIDWDMEWDGKMQYYRLVPFILVCKVDGKEGDKLCGQFLAKGENVKNLCRICVCPTDKSSIAYREDMLKTQPHIQRLVQLRRRDKLRDISQQDMWNAFYELRFASHNEGGIHQACPAEPLHWMLIGQLGYSRDGFFDQTGETSNLSEALNTIGAAIGVLMQRQSDRDLPRTLFNRGVQAGKVMAHEMTGVVVVMTAILRSTRGRNAILSLARGKQKEFFADEGFIRQWIMFLETQLQLDAWLQLREMRVDLVERAKTKIKEYMNMSKRIGQRTKGMRYNTLNFHVAKHIPADILAFGVPANYDTFANERHHKRDKKTSQRTNKHMSKFDIQMAKKIQERHAVDIGMEEMNGRKRWHYYSVGGFDHSDRPPKNTQIPPFDPILTGVRVRFYKRDGKMIHVVSSKMKAKDKYVHDEPTRLGLVELLNFCSDEVKELNVYSCLNVHDNRADKATQIYRASPYEEGRPWYDWGIFDLSEPDNPEFRNFVPCQIKCFIDMRHLEDKMIGGKEPGIYALVETTHLNPQMMELRRSELWEPWVKTCCSHNDFAATHNKMELVNTARLTSPAVLIPDLDNDDKRAYLRLVPRSTWAQLFNDWLEAPHTRGFDDPVQKKKAPEPVKPMSKFGKRKRK